MNLNIQRILITLPGILLGLTLHEYCHAFAAYKLGDNTAKDMGRLTFNPIKHIDPIGFLFIIIAGFGWAKPVLFDPNNLQNYRRDKAIIAAAGPFSNLALALFMAALVWLWHLLPGFLISRTNEEFILSIFYSRPIMGFVTVIYFGAMINLGLFVFNLFPIPPLEGSHIAFSGLNINPDIEYNIMKFGAPLLFIIIIVQNRMGITILPIWRIVTALLNFIMPFTL